MFIGGWTSGNLGALFSGGWGPDAWFARYDSAGNRSWIRQLGLGAATYTGALAPDGAGGVYVGGEVWSGPVPLPSQAWLARYDSAGSQTWLLYPGPNNLYGVRGAVPDGAGGVIVSAQVLSTPAADAWLARYDGAGNPTWTQQFGSAGEDYAGTLAPDGVGGVYVVGVTDGDLGGPNAGNDDAWLARFDGGLTATRFCAPAVANSTGQPGAMDATGSSAVATNDVTLGASQLPLNSFGYFLTSMTQGFSPNPGGSQGILCLGGSIGRFVGPGQIQHSGAGGQLSLALDLTQHPAPTGFVGVQPGETWRFQAWYRDANPGPTSNFTDAVSVTFH